MAMEVGFSEACLCRVRSLGVSSDSSFVSFVFLALFRSYLFPNLEISVACVCLAVSSLRLQVVFLLFHWLSCLVLLSLSFS